MSDYFARLAARTLGVTPLPRPVIPSRFERPSAAGFEEVELGTVAPPVPAPPGTPGSSARPGADAASPPPFDAHTLDPRDQPTRREPSATFGRPREPPTTHALDGDGPAEPARFVERITTQERDHVLVERETLVAAPAQAPAPAGAPPPHAAVPPQRVETRPIGPPPPIPSQPVARQPLEGAGDPPVIHVTIGRIDVRAVSTPPPSRERPQPPRPARSSLEDYLRHGGGRS